jgi:hypothetical protein
MTNEPNEQVIQTNTTAARRTHPAWYLAIVLALAGNVALLVHSHTLARSLADMQESTQAQLAKLNDQLAQNNAESGKRVDGVAQEARESVAAAQDRALKESRRNSAALAAKLAETRDAQQQAQQQVSGQLDELKQANSTAASKLDQISGDVGGVKSDVASTKSEVEGHGSDLKRMNGDMGVMSGLIATNGKELAALRELGERNYIEFDLKKKSEPQKVGGIQLAVVKADPKRNRFTLNVIADDKRVEKRDRTINEPVQLYVSGNRQPLEIVVNDVKKDEVVGYLAVPKVGAKR